MYGAEKSVLKQADKLSAIRSELNTRLLNGVVEVMPINQEVDPITGRLRRINLSRRIIEVETVKGPIEIIYGEVSLEHVGNTQVLHSAPLITMNVDQPYKF